MLVTLGALSYSLYIWQQLFLGVAGRHWWTVFPVNLLGVLAAGDREPLPASSNRFLRLKARVASGAEAASARAGDT